MGVAGFGEDARSTSIWAVDTTGLTSKAAIPVTRRWTFIVVVRVHWGIRKSRAESYIELRIADLGRRERSLKFVSEERWRIGDHADNLGLELCAILNWCLQQRHHLAVNGVISPATQCE